MDPIPALHPLIEFVQDVNLSNGSRFKKVAYLLFSQNLFTLEPKVILKSINWKPWQTKEIGNDLLSYPLIEYSLGLPHFDSSLILMGDSSYFPFYFFKKLL